MGKNKQVIKKIEEKNVVKTPSKNKQAKLTKKEVLLVAVFSLVILVSGIIVYYKTLDFEFINFDESSLILDRKEFNSDIKNLPAAFKTHIYSYYRPLLGCSIIFDSYYGGIQKDGTADPTVFHRSNFIFHLLASLCVFWGLLAFRYDKKAAFLLALGFTVHPVLTPAEAWVFGRNDSMITIFIMLSLITFITYYRRNDVWGWLALLGNMFFFAASLFTKEISVVFPLIVFFWLFYVKKEKFANYKNYIILAAWFGIMLVWFSMQKIAMAGIEIPDEQLGFSSIVTNFPTLFALLGKIILPFKMIIASNFEALEIVSGIAFIALLTLLVALSPKESADDNPQSKKQIKNKYNMIIFGGLWFLIFLVPTFWIVYPEFKDFFQYAEHRAYLPLFGILIILLEIFKLYKINFNKALTIGIASLVILVLAVRSFIYADTFENRFVFWNHFIKCYPEMPRGYTDLGLAYYGIEDYEKAEQLYLKSVALKSNYKGLYVNLCALYYMKNDFDKAEQYIRKAIEIEPNAPDTYFNLAQVAMAKGDFQTAADGFEKAIYYNPEAGYEWWLNLGLAHSKLKNNDKALFAYNKVLQMNPNFALCYMNIGVIYYEQKKIDEAIQMLNKAIQLDPKLETAYRNLVIIYANDLKRPDKVQQIAQEMRKNLGTIPPDFEAYLKTVQ